MVYTTKNGKEVKKRSMKRLTDCKNECCKNVLYEDQCRIFKSYWEQGTYEKRVNFVSHHLELHAKKRSRGQNLKNRKYTIDYYLTVESNRYRVCKTCFLSTLGETQAFIQSVSNKVWTGMNISVNNSDQRGKRIPKNKTPDNKIKEIENHIKKFPAYESHYSRSHMSQKYLPAGLNVSIMHQLYSQEVEAPLSKKIYRQVFAATGLKFKNPQLDTCHKCNEFAARLKFETDENIKQQLLVQKEKHEEAAELAYQTKENDKKKAKESDGLMEVNSFDLQQCLPIPLLNSSVAFYKRPLWIFNLTINSTLSNTQCYMWHEAIGKRDANEIASCLYKHFRGLSSTVKYVVLYSDCCPGQNKNKIVSGMFSALIANHPSIEIFDLKFLEPGHTHMECDSDHAIFEKIKKKCNVELHHPDDWYKKVETAKQNKPFKVIRMTQNDFFKFDKLFSDEIVMSTKNMNEEKFDWKNVKWTRFIKEQGTMLYKRSFDENEPFLKLNLNRRGSNLFQLENTLELCYKKLIPISIEKKQDLIDLVHLVRPDVQTFYKNLPTSDKERTNDPDIDEYGEKETEFEISVTRQIDSHDAEIENSDL